MSVCPAASAHPGRRSPDVGSARSGHPSRCASSATSPRGHPPVRSRDDDAACTGQLPRGPIDVGRERLGVAVRTLHARFVALRHVDDLTGRHQRLLERAVDVDRSRLRTAAGRHRLAADPPPRSASAADIRHRRMPGTRADTSRTAPPGRSSGSRRCRAGAAAGRPSAGSSGMRDCDASTTAGNSSAAAVPLVQATPTGRRSAFASPSAKNALERSSRWTCTVTPGMSRPARARAASSATRARRTRVAPRPRRARRSSAAAHARETSPVAITSPAPSAPRSPCATSASPSAIESPHAAWSAAVPVSTGIRSRPVARPDALHRPDRERPRDQPEQRPLREPDRLVDDEHDDARRTIVANAPTTHAR